MNSQKAESPSDAIADESLLASAADDGGWEKWRSLTAEAYMRFHEKLEANRPLFPGLATYGAVRRVEATQGTFAWQWGGGGEIQETVNSLNAWGLRLHEWGAWNMVVPSYDEENDKWELLSHFVEPIAFFCMLQPSSLAERLTVVAETLLHQANQLVFPDEPDRLDQDILKPGMSPRRSDRRKQLNRLGKHWPKFAAFRDALLAMDGPDYQEATRNFRDLSAHAFAPRLMIGQVVRAIRSVGPWREMTPQPDGTFLLVDHPTKKGVQYSMQAMEPLPLDDTRSANLVEYQKALTAMNAFAALVDELCDRMDAMPKRDAKAP